MYIIKQRESEMSSKVCKPNKLVLNGIFGLFKEKGDSVEDYKTWIRLTHYHESELQPNFKAWKMPSIAVDITPRYAETFTTGVLCVGIGLWATRLTPLTTFWPHEWLVSAKLGIETKHYCLDSEVVNQMPFNHINEDILTETLKQFIGQKEQSNPPALPWKESLLIQKEQINRKRVERVVTDEPKNRIRECHSIEVLSFKPPELKLRVISDGFFSCRTFVHDLGHKLECCAHLTHLSLNRMGVITAQDCLKKYELHLSQLSEAIDKYSKLFSKDLNKFKDLKSNHRRI